MGDYSNLNLTGNSRRALVLARDEAFLAKQTQIETQHILSGLILERGCVYELMIYLGLDVNGLIETAHSRSLARVERPEKKNGYFVPRVDTVMNEAEKLARGMGCEEIGVEHIFLGLLKEGRGIAYQILEENGVRESEALRVIGESYEEGRKHG